MHKEEGNGEGHSNNSHPKCTIRVAKVLFHYFLLPDIGCQPIAGCLVVMVRKSFGVAYIYVDINAAGAWARTILGKVTESGRRKRCVFGRTSPSCIIQGRHNIENAVTGRVTNEIDIRERNGRK